MAVVWWQTPQSSSSGPGQEKKKYRIWHIEYYSTYFDVDSAEVGARIIRSLVPFSYKFMESVADNPDLCAAYLKF